MSTPCVPQPGALHVLVARGSADVCFEPELATFDDVDHGIVTMRFSNGGLGVIQNSWRAPYGYDIRAEVHGTLGIQPKLCGVTKQPTKADSHFRVDCSLLAQQFINRLPRHSQGIRQF